MQETFDHTTEQAAAFQKIWTETATRLFQTAFTTAPNSPPPEVLRQMRSGIFQALAQSWDEFLRSPQFLENMRQWMESAISFRKMTNDFMARVRTEVQAPSRDDIDTVMLNVRHMEKRLLDRIDELSHQVSALQNSLAVRESSSQAARPPAAKRRARTAAASANGKTIRS